MNNSSKLLIENINPLKEPFDITNTIKEFPKSQLTTEDGKYKFHIYYRNVMDVCLCCRSKYKCSVDKICHGLEPKKGTYRVIKTSKVNSGKTNLVWTSCPMVLTYKDKTYEITGVLLNPDKYTDYIDKTDPRTVPPIIEILQIKSSEGIIFPKDEGNKITPTNIT